MSQDYAHRHLAPGDDLGDAFSVRQAVFVDEQGFSAELEFDETDPKAHHIVLYDSGKPFGTGRIFAGDEPGVYVIGRVAVLASHRGGGSGHLLMTRLEAVAREIGANAITLGAQCHAQGFYEKLGYAPYGEEYLDEHCPHIHMRKQL